MKQLLLEPEQVRFSVLAARTKAKTKERSTVFSDKRYGNMPVYRLMLRWSWDEIYWKAFVAAVLAKSERITRLVCATLAAIKPRGLLAATSFNQA